jgi:heme-degrading monooxygenase HmoA
VDGIADTPRPPYVAVIFTNVQTDDLDGYDETAARMEALAKEQPGYLGFESARSAATRGLGIAVSYWASDDDARAWKRVVDHAEAQRQGRERWYAAYRVRVARVEREYGKDGEVL